MSSSTLITDTHEVAATIQNIDTAERQQTCRYDRPPARRGGHRLQSRSSSPFSFPFYSRVCPCPLSATARGTAVRAVRLISRTCLVSVTFPCSPIGCILVVPFLHPACLMKKGKKDQVRSSSKGQYSSSPIPLVTSIPSSLHNSQPTTPAFRLAVTQLRLPDRLSIFLFACSRVAGLLFSALNSPSTSTAPAAPVASAATQNTVLIPLAPTVTLTIQPTPTIAPVPTDRPRSCHNTVHHLQSPATRHYHPARLVLHHARRCHDNR